MNTNFDFSPSKTQTDFESMFNGLENFPIEELLPYIGTAFLLAGILGLIFFVTSLIASPALVDAVNRISRGGSYRFSDSFSIGVDFFFKFLGLALLTFAIFLGFILVAGVIGGIAFAIDKLLGVLSLIILIPISLFGFFVLFNIFEIAKRAIVVRTSKIGDALEEGYTLLKNNFGDFFMFFLINMGLMIGFFMAAAMVFGIVAIPVALIAIDGDASIMTWVLLGLFVGLPVSMVAGGWSATFFHSLYTLFYFELVEPNRPDTASAVTTSG